jgi:rubrerythrin
MGNAAAIALEQAVRFESDGRDFYLRAAEAATHPGAKTVFLSLAEDETNHIERVREIFEELKHKPGWPDELTMVARQTGVLDVFERAFPDAAARDAGSVDALRTALTMEKSGIGFYRDRMNEATCAAEIEFFQRLLNEELLHVRAIDGMLQKLGG